MPSPSARARSRMRGSVVSLPIASANLPMVIDRCGRGHRPGTERGHAPTPEPLVAEHGAGQRGPAPAQALVGRAGPAVVDHGGHAREQPGMGSLAEDEHAVPVRGAAPGREPAPARRQDAPPPGARQRLGHHGREARRVLSRHAAEAHVHGRLPRREEPRQGAGRLPPGVRAEEPAARHPALRAHDRQQRRFGVQPLEHQRLEAAPRAARQLMAERFERAAGRVLQLERLPHRRRRLTRSARSSLLLRLLG
jgi:hypothetical protein